MSNPDANSARQPSEFAQLFEAARAGDKIAAQVLFERYQHHLLRIIRRRLRQPVRRLLDSADILQEVWLRFFEEKM